MQETLLLAERSTNRVSVAEEREFRGALVGPWQLIRDFVMSFKHSGLWLYSSWVEVLLTYRSTLLGPLWILVGTLTFVFLVGSLYGRVVLVGQSNAYLPHLAVGLTFFFFLTQSLVGSCHVFFSNRSSILDGDASYTDLTMKVITKNFIDFLHSTPAIVIAMIVAGIAPSWGALLVPFSLLLVLLNLVWICVILAIVGVRYRDVEEFTQSLMRLFFFVTPIMWVANQQVRGPLIDALLYLNPFYYFLEVLRAPLLYGHIPYFELGVLIATAPIGWLVACILYARTRPWLALWL